MKKFLLAAAAVLAAALALVPAALADVARHQTQSGQLTVLLNNGNLHTFDIVIRPCDNSFTGTGVSDQLPNVFVTETIEGTLSGGQLSFVATYTGQAAQQFPGYRWFTNTPGALGTPIPGGDTLGSVFTLTGTLGTLTSSSWANHGEYVAAQPQGFRDDAAHSCIGKPIQS